MGQVAAPAPCLVSDAARLLAALGLLLRAAAGLRFIAALVAALAAFLDRGAAAAILAAASLPLRTAARLGHRVAACLVLGAASQLLCTAVLLVRRLVRDKKHAKCENRTQNHLVHENLTL